MMHSKIADHHLSRKACIDIRQSTMSQVRFKRQYNLANQAKSLGWTPDQIRILDGDLGHSGEQATHRDDFKTLVNDVAMGHVGAIFSLEASRLARSNKDWHRLLELCAVNFGLQIPVAIVVVRCSIVRASAKSEPRQISVGCGLAGRAPPSVARPVGELRHRRRSGWTLAIHELDQCCERGSGVSTSDFLELATQRPEPPPPGRNGGGVMSMSVTLFGRSPIGFFRVGMPSTKGNS
jgi:hypothetical protein